MSAETLGFKYEELDEAGQQKAREWWSGVACADDSWYEPAQEDFIRVLRLFDLDTEGGQIYFSGFSSQGDGASFKGWYRHTGGAHTPRVKAYCNDETLIKLAERLDILQTAIQLQHGQFWMFDVERPHTYYSHSYTMALGNLQSDGPGESVNYEDDVHDEALAIMRELADWYYGQLESYYDHETSDETAKEALTSNDYRFDETGHII